MNETALSIALWRDGAAVLALLAAAATLLWTGVKQAAARAVAHAFDKRLEDHRSQLALAAAAAQLEHQRRLTDFTQFTTERHLVYARVYRRLVVAEGLLTALVGMLKMLPNFSKYDLADLAELRKSMTATGEEMATIETIWNTDRARGVDLLEATYEESRKRSAFAALQKFRNTQTLNELFFSAQVAEALQEAWGELNSLQVCLQYPEGVTPESLMQKKHAVVVAIAKVRSAMQKELARGDYPVDGD